MSYGKKITEITDAGRHIRRKFSRGGWRGWHSPFTPGFRHRSSRHTAADHLSMPDNLTTMNTDTLHYAGFGPRLAANLLDFVIMIPLIAVSLWGSSHFRLFELYYFLPGILYGLFYSVSLVHRYGGTPGKLIVGIRIRKLDGEPVGYREALLRYFPEALLGLLMSIGFILSVFHMSDAEYVSLSFMERAKRMNELAPSWQTPLQWIQTAWVWSELLVLLTNRKRRALHDFIAGTVVVHASPKVTPPEVSNPALLV